jgi:hypothetical protein
LFVDRVDHCGDRLTAMRAMRTPFFILALMVLLAAFALEIGSNWILLNPSQSAASSNVQSQLGIPSLALFDASFVWTLVLMLLGIVLDRALVGRIQGILTLIFSIVIIILGIKTLITSFVLFLIMFALLSSVFGWIVYIPIFGFFDTTDAATVLATITFFKLACVVLLVIAQQDYLKSTRFIILVLLSLLLDLLLSFLQGFPPGVLVSVTDAIGAIVISIVAIVYALVQAIFAIVAIVRALLGIRLNRTQRTDLDQSTPA